jgi:hypothetical protein
VTAYKLEYSVDGVLWSEANGGDELAGNDDNDNEKTNKFDPPLVARYVRFLPTSWSGVGVAMQAEVTAKPCSKGNKKEGRELWTKNSGKACTDLLADFGTTVGTVTVTKRVDVDQVWVLTPGETASIEVLGEDLLWKDDRVMVIDSTGVCGVSEPTASSSGPLTTTKKYSHWVAEPPVFTDPPGDDLAPGAKADDEVDVLWRKKSGKYCPGNNMPLSELPKDASKHTCYNKCVRNAPCKGLDCHCSGLMQGYDGPESTALCLPENKCKEVCKGTEGCYGIDMAERVIEVRDVTMEAPATVGKFFKFFKKDTLPFGGQGPYDPGSGDSEYIVQHWRKGVKLRTAAVKLTDSAGDTSAHDAHGRLADGSEEGQFEVGDVLLFVDHLESGPYSLSYADTLDCPAGDEAIPTADLCEAAAESLGGTYSMTFTYMNEIDDPTKPGGCYTDGTNMKFNANAGVKQAGKRVVCIRGGASRCFLNGQRKNPSDEGSCEE